MASYKIVNDTCEFSQGITQIRKIEFKKKEFTKIVFPNSVKSIGHYAFSYKILLKSVDFPIGLESIGDCAFYNCDELETITIPDSVKKIGKGAFNMCKKLKEIIIGSGVEVINEETFACCKVEKIIIPNSVKTIRQNAFSECSNLKSVEIPSSVKVIKSGAFYGTPITDIYLCDHPSYYNGLVKAFDNGGFGGREKKAIEMSEFMAQQFNDGRFKVYDGITLHVPEGMVQDYKTHPFFGKFDKVVAR